MKTQSEREVLEELLHTIRRKLLRRSFFHFWVQTSVFLLPVLAVGIAADQRWNSGNATWAIMAVGGLLSLLIPALRAFSTLGGRTQSALVFDEHANLKDRVSSAYEFLKENRELDEARLVQVRDAVERAKQIDCSKVFQFRWPRYAKVLPALAVLLILSFWMPSLQPPVVNAAVDETKIAQLDQIKELEKELAQKDQPKELEDVLKKLEQIRKSYEKGEISERDVLLQLARLDEDLRNKTKEMGAENLEGEMNTILPHLMSSAAAVQVATAIKEDKLDKAVAELEKLGEKVKNDQLSKEEKRELAMNMGMAAAKLGGKDKSAFGGDFSKASESLEKSDSNGFCSACKSIGDKLGAMKKCRSMNMACNKIGLCKSGLCQSENQERGFASGPKNQSKGKGGLKAGTNASGDPFGESSRLNSSMRKMLQVAGQAGEGPVQTETEITEGQLSPSQIDLKEVHSSYAAVAEEAIEKESVPLSHRYHVKRYFQSIRPQE